MRFEFRLTRSIDVSVALTIIKPAVNEPATATIKRKIPLEVVRLAQVYVTGISELLKSAGILLLLLLLLSIIFCFRS